MRSTRQDVQTGLGTYDAGSRVWGTPVVVSDTVYVNTLGHKLIALDAATGKQRWVFDKPKGALAGSPNVQRRHALRRLVRQPSLRRGCGHAGISAGSFNAKNWIWEGPAVVSGTLYFGDVSGNVYALDAATQKRRVGD